jgi:hypothetical protein
MKRLTEAPFAQLLTQHIEFATGAEEDVQEAKRAALQAIVLRIQTVERKHKYREVEDLRAAVVRRFKQLSSVDPAHFEYGPWTTYLVAAELDPEGAGVFLRNIIRAELEGILPTRWTAS